MNAQPVKMIGKYPVIKQIARHSRAAVILSKSPTTQESVAIKLYPRKLAQAQGFIRQFSRELGDIQKLNHPNILPIYQYDIVSQFPLIEMPYMVGGDLEARIEKGTNLAQLKDAVGQIFQVLLSIHRQGVVHGNIKPSNILFDMKGNVYLSDFWLDCVAEQAETPYQSIYMSPEQLHSQPMDSRSDIYSFGMVLFAWITGYPPPYSAITESEDTYEPLSLRTYLSDITVSMNEVIQRATEYDPSQRFGSMRDFSHAFFDALRTDKLFLKMQANMVNSSTTRFSYETRLDKYSRGRTEPSEAETLISFWAEVLGRLYSLYYYGRWVLIILAILISGLSILGTAMSDWFQNILDFLP